MFHASCLGVRLAHYAYNVVIFYFNLMFLYETSISMVTTHFHTTYTVYKPLKKQQELSNTKILNQE